MFEHVCVLIPAFKPDEELFSLVTNLKKIGFSDILIVNDGSGPAFDIFFQTLRDQNCKVISLDSNCGKGSALKAGFSYIQEQGGWDWVVTADADGQHSPRDILAVSKLAVQNKSDESVVLGVRNFDPDSTPFKSRVGNLISGALFRLLFQVPLSDTQTGLRAFPKSLLATLMKIPGSRYEYELNVLSVIAKARIVIQQVEISTIYLAGNSGSHFRPIVDSIRVFRQLFVYGAASLICAFVDIVIFALLHSLAAPHFQADLAIQISVVIARLFSASLNFWINFKLVFVFTGSKSVAAFKYFALATILLITSTTLTPLISEQITKNPVIAKIIVDTGTFFAAYFLQKFWVFGAKRLALRTPKQ